MQLLHQERKVPRVRAGCREAKPQEPDVERGEVYFELREREFQQRKSHAGSKPLGSDGIFQRQRQHERDTHAAVWILQ